MKRWVYSVGVVLLAASVRLWGLGVQSLWLDEAVSHLFSVLSLDVAWEAIIVDAVHPPLYYLLLRPWLVLVGESEFVLRFPSALAGVLTVALLLRAGRDWLGERAARWASFLLALNPFHVWYSQEARMYAFSGLLALAALMAFRRVLHGWRVRPWLALVVVSALAYLTHYFALYVPLAGFVFLLATFRRHHRALVRWASAQALAALPLAVWLTVFYTLGGDTFGIGWIRRPQAVDLLETLWSFGIAYDGRVTVPVVAGMLVWGGLLVAGAWRGQGRRGARWLLALSLALPLLVTFLLSQRRPTYVDRFFIGSLPAFLLLAGAGLARLRPPVRWTTGLALACLGIWGVMRFHTDPLFAKEDWRGATAYVQAHEESDDALAVRYFPYALPVRRYYRGMLEQEVVTLNQQTMPLEEIAAGHGRLWLIYRARHSDLHHLSSCQPFSLEREEKEAVVRAWIDGHPPAEVIAFAGVTVVLFDLGDDG